MRGVFRELRGHHGRGWGNSERRWLARGSTGEAVKQVQQALGVPVDGFFGPQTEEAVKKFQTSHDMKVDGVVGPLTLAKLCPSAEKKECEESSSDRGCGDSNSERRWLARGSWGEPVKQVQQALGVPADGFFGPQTEEAVKKFQTSHDLQVDGVVGPRTWAKLSPSAEQKESSPVPEQKENAVSAAEKPWLKKGSTGDRVTELQRMLGTVVDGDFGRRTEEAVKEYQFSHDLPVDGIVGPRTWAKLSESKPAVAPNAAMDALAAMGFTNVELNTRLLQKFNGDVEQVIAEFFGSQ
jgi:peptidoglycan hydrolase-like protein with peptidoglycan-binding domain